MRIRWFFALLILIMLPMHVWGAGVNTLQTGSLSDPTVWAGTPGTDYPIVKIGHTITVDQNMTMGDGTTAIQLAETGTANTVNVAKLIIAPNVRLTCNGDFVFNGGGGNSTKRPVKLELGAGSELYLNSGKNIYMGIAVLADSGYGAITITLAGAAGNPAKITSAGGGRWWYQNYFVYAGNVLNWNNFEISGWDNGANYNLITSTDYNLTNGYFHDNASIDIGTTSVASATNCSFSFIDIRKSVPRPGSSSGVSAPVVLIRSISATPTGKTTIDTVTVDDSHIMHYGRGAEIKNCVAHAVTDSGYGTTHDNFMRVPAVTAVVKVSGSSATSFQHNDVWNPGASTLHYWRFEIVNGNQYRYWKDTSSAPASPTWIGPASITEGWITIPSGNGLKVKFSALSGNNDEVWTFRTQPATQFFTSIGPSTNAYNNVISNDLYNAHVVQNTSAAAAGSSAEFHHNVIESWNTGGNNQIYPALGTDATRTDRNNIHIGYENAYLNNGVGMSHGTIWNIENNTIVIRPSGGQGALFAQEIPVYKGRINLKNNLVHLATGGYGVGTASGAGLLHREIGKTDYNSFSTDSGTVTRYDTDIKAWSLSTPVPNGGNTGGATMSLAGSFTGSAETSYAVRVVAGPLIEWSDDGGSTWKSPQLAIPAVGVYLALTSNPAQAVNFSLVVKFSAAPAVGDSWTFTGTILSTNLNTNPVAGYGLNDVSVAPTFADPTLRDLAKYTDYVVAGNTLENAFAKRQYAFSEAIKANGRDIYGNAATPNAAFAPTTIKAWIESGYAPTNMALATAGEGGTYIGAVAVQAVTTSPKRKGFRFGPLQFRF